MTKKKFKYNGASGNIDFDCIVGGIYPSGSKLEHGQILEVEDDFKLPDGTILVNRLRRNGLWKEIKTKPGRPKKAEGSEE